MERVLVTGGCGYIGSILVPTLLNAGYEVIVLDKLIYDQVTLMDCCRNKKFSIIQGDARNKNLIDIIFARYGPIHYVFPLACIVGAPACDQDPSTAKTTNLDAVKLIAKKGSRIIFPNTNSGYGIGQEGIYCTEDSPLNPISDYARLKVAAEKAVLDRGNSIVLRLATVFGASPRMRTDLLVNDFVSTAVNTGHIELSEKNFKRNYIHVKDVARVFLHCMDNFQKMKGQAYNVGLSNANLSKWELCLKIKEHIPDLRIYENESRKDPDQRNYIVSNAKLEATGFTPQYSLDDGIVELIKCCQIIKNKKFSNVK